MMKGTRAKPEGHMIAHRDIHTTHIRSPSMVEYICAFLVGLRPPRNWKNWLGPVPSPHHMVNIIEMHISLENPRPDFLNGHIPKYIYGKM